MIMNDQPERHTNVSQSHILSVLSYKSPRLKTEGFSKPIVQYFSACKSETISQPRRGLFEPMPRELESRWDEFGCVRISQSSQGEVFLPCVKSSYGPSLGDSAFIRNLHSSTTLIGRGEYNVWDFGNVPNFHL